MTRWPNHPGASCDCPTCKRINSWGSLLNTNMIEFPEKDSMIIGYLKARLEERSTWAAIGAGVTAAASLSWPWNIIFVSCAVMAALVPTRA